MLARKRAEDAAKARKEEAEVKWKREYPAVVAQRRDDYRDRQMREKKFALEKANTESLIDERKARAETRTATLKMRETESKERAQMEKDKVARLASAKTADEIREAQKDALGFIGDLEKRREKYAEMANDPLTMHVDPEGALSARDKIAEIDAQITRLRPVVNQFMRRVSATGGTPPPGTPPAAAGRVQIGNEIFNTPIPEGDMKGFIRMIRDKAKSSGMDPFDVAQETLAVAQQYGPQVFFPNYAGEDPAAFLGLPQQLGTAVTGMRGAPDPRSQEIAMRNLAAAWSRAARTMKD
jgi:hypothetical protein